MTVAGISISDLEQRFKVGVEHLRHHRWAEAEFVFRDMLVQGADSPSVYHNLGVALKCQNKFTEALTALRTALALQPNYPDARVNLGDTLRRLGQCTKAIEELGYALALRPDNPDAYNKLGLAFNDAQQGLRAVEAFRKALDLKPNFTEAWNNLGRTYQDMKRLLEAAGAYNHALAIRPELPEVLNNLGGALRELGRPAEAIEACRRALAIRPDFWSAWNNLGIVLRDVYQPAQSADALRRALALQGNLPDTWGNLAVVLKDIAQLDECLACYDQKVLLQPENAMAAGDRLYAMYFHPGYDAPAIYRESRKWNERYYASLAAAIAPHENDLSPRRRLRIGYVSPDFRRHCEALFMLPLLAHHNHQDFEIFCYSGATSPDAVTARHQSHADVWRNVAGLSDQALAHGVRQDKIDILIDLTLHMGSGRLGMFARKPAPVQATWLGYAGTTGLDTMDYRFTDPRLDPLEDTKSEIRNPKSESNPNDQNPNGQIANGVSGQQETLRHLGIGKLGIDSDFGFRTSDFSTKEPYYSERSIRLPDAYWCYDPWGMEDSREVPLPEPAPLPALSAGRVTFGCLNNYTKVSDPTLALWARVMAALPDSRLLLLAPPGPPQERVIVKLGVARDRVQFVGNQSRPDYLKTYHRIDVCLDPVPCHGGTTSLDSLWMGVPVVTLVGNTAVGRAGLSILHQLALTDLVAWDQEQFVQIAVELGRDLERLVRLRTTLRQRLENSPLMDGPRFARNMESLYRRMWVAWCSTRG